LQDVFLGLSFSIADLRLGCNISFLFISAL